MWYTVIDEQSLLQLAKKSAKSRADKLESALNEAEKRGFTFVTVDRPVDGDACYIFTAADAKRRLGNIK
jgi:hypothetical protein